MKTVVGVSDYRVSNNIEEVIITYALGSCLGISLYDPVKKVGGLLHVMLPLSRADPEKARLKPAMYVDSGLTTLFDEMYRFGAQKKNLVISVAGGASMRKNNQKDYFKIGRRNFTVFRKMLWKNDLMITNQDVGGNKSRTMALYLADGQVTINKEPIKSNKATRATGFM